MLGKESVWSSVSKSTGVKSRSEARYTATRGYRPQRLLLTTTPGEKLARTHGRVAQVLDRDRRRSQRPRMRTSVQYFAQSSASNALRTGTVRAPFAIQSLGQPALKIRLVSSPVLELI